MALTKKERQRFADLVETEGFHDGIMSGYMDDISTDKEYNKLLEAFKEASDALESYVGWNDEDLYDEDDDDDSDDDDDDDED